MVGKTYPYVKGKEYTLEVPNNHPLLGPFYTRYPLLVNSNSLSESMA